MNKSSLQISDILKMTMLPFLVYMFNYYFNFFQQTWYVNNHFDSYMHFIGGVSIAYAVNHLLNILAKKNLLIVNSRFIWLLLVLAIVISSAVMWENYEFLSDYVYHTRNQPSLLDTMKDLFLGMMGGLLYGLMALVSRSYERKG